RSPEVRKLRCFRCGKDGHRAVQCRAPFDPTRKIWQPRGGEVAFGGLDHKLQIVEGKRLAVSGPLQQQDGVQEEVNEQGWMSVSKKGMSRPGVSSPSHISLHKRFEGLEIEMSRDDGVPLSELDTGQSSDCDFSYADVKEAVFSLEDDKTPGIDGFPAAFFKHCWPSIGDEICEAILVFFRKGSSRGLEGVDGEGDTRKDGACASTEEVDCSLDLWHLARA
ncbi:hypothetical protein Dimus_029001, partial [Dionaea muscipula]